MFVKSCNESAQHPAHEYTHLWVKAELPFLLHPEEYPDQWEAEYMCLGIFITAWTVVYMHQDCPECEECAELAVESADHDGSHGTTWKHMIPVPYPEGVFAEVGHQATVERV